MPILLGSIVGRAFGLLLGRIVLSHAALTVGVWDGVAGGSYWLVRQNIGPGAAPYAGVLATLALLGWTLWRPAENRAKLWLLDGLYVWTRLGIGHVLLVAVMALLAVHGVIRSWLVDVWRTALLGAALLLMQRVMMSWVGRSHLRAGGLSRVDA